MRTVPGNAGRALRKRRGERGLSLVEVMVSLVLLALGLVGLAQMQIVGSRANRFGRNMTLASELARDLVENATLWKYGDPRLAPMDTVAALSDPKVAALFSLPRDETLPSSQRAQFGEVAGDPNAVNAGALGTYAGTGSDLDKDGRPDFRRYWSVLAVDPNGDGVADSKFVVVVVRWHEPGVGMRQVFATTVKANAEVFRL